MNAVTPIPNLNEAQRIQQALKMNPNDIAAMLKLAATIQDEPGLKRQLLDRILSLDPVNQPARDMLLEMDRTEFRGSQFQPQSAAFNSTITPKEQGQKPLLLRYSIVHQILVYPLVTICVLFTIQAIKDWQAFLFFASILLFLIIPVWYVSAVVEARESSIKLLRLFGLYRREIQWEQIQRIKPNALGVGMKLITGEGMPLEISSQIRGYTTLVEILYRIRPDLFKLEEPKTFQKKSFGKYGIFLLLVPASLISLIAILFPPFIPGIVMSVALFFFWKSALHSFHLVKVEEGRVSFKYFRRNQELTRQQIKDVSLVSRRSRRAVTKSFVQIETQEGNRYLFSRFPEGNEIMYGYLRDWWSASKNS